MKVELKKLHHPSGEVLPYLARSDGSSWVLPLAWMLEDRHAGGSSRILENVRRLADLYRALLADSIDDPDQHLLRNGLDVDEARRAIKWATRNVGRTGTVAGTRNRQVASWLGFLSWLEARRAHTLSKEGDDARLRRALAAAGVTESFLRLQRIPDASNDEKHPFTPFEMKAIEEVLRAEALDGGIEHRNWCLYQLCRSGLRIQEALALYRADLGVRETDSKKARRGALKIPLSIRVERRPDDPRDPRSDKAKTKRGSRWVLISDKAMEALRAYADCYSDAADPFLIRSFDGKYPLSASRANDVQAELRPKLVQHFNERFHGMPCSLEQFGWHRLRHTRAWGLILGMVQDDRKKKELTESEEELLLEIMGWKDMRSARPYTRLLRVMLGETGLHERRYGP